jgi:hypothetical protein
MTNRQAAQILANQSVIMEVLRTQLVRQPHPTVTEGRLAMKLSGALGATEAIIEELKRDSD